MAVVHLRRLFGAEQRPSSVHTVIVNVDKLWVTVHVIECAFDADGDRCCSSCEVLTLKSGKMEVSSLDMLVPRLTEQRGLADVLRERVMAAHVVQSMLATICGLLDFGFATEVVR